jgi:integrase/recombinase XerD
MPHPWVPRLFEAMLAERNAAANTIAAYRRDLDDYCGFLARRGLSPETAGRADVEDWLAELAARGLSGRTVARRLSAVRQLHRFALSEGLRADDPAQLLRGPGRPQRLPDTLTEAEAARLVAAARETGRDETARARNACLLELLYATGMRVSELVGLPLAAVRGDPRMILVRGKGGRERMVPLSPPAREALAAWLRLRQAEGRSAAWAFPSRGASGHLTREGFFLLLREIAVKAGIPPSRVSPHVLRHAFATHLLAGGADLRSIQTLLGHADLATTEIYTHVVDDGLRDLVLTRHPLARKGGE